MQIYLALFHQIAW